MKTTVQRYTCSKRLSSFYRQYMLSLQASSPKVLAKIKLYTILAKLLKLTIKERFFGKTYSPVYRTNSENNFSNVTSRSVEAGMRTRSLNGRTAHCRQPTETLGNIHRGYRSHRRQCRNRCGRILSGWHRANPYPVRKRTDRASFHPPDNAPL